MCGLGGATDLVVSGCSAGGLATFLHTDQWCAAVPKAKPAPAPSLPLAGLRVANFGWGWLGPVAGQTLSRLGAEVYKIESRVRVDINRTIPPFAPGEPHPDRALQNHAGWAGNGSITLDLKNPEGQALAQCILRVPMGRDLSRCQRLHRDSQG